MKLKDYFKPRRVEVPMFELASNPVIHKGPTPGWFKKFYAEYDYSDCKVKLTNCTDIKEVQDYLLNTLPWRQEVLMKVIVDHFPQYKELANKILMLQ
jgi:hypothetical protein